MRIKLLKLLLSRETQLRIFSRKEGTWAPVRLLEAKIPITPESAIPAMSNNPSDICSTVAKTYFRLPLLSRSAYDFLCICSRSTFRVYPEVSFGPAHRQFSQKGHLPDGPFRTPNLSSKLMIVNAKLSIFINGYLDIRTKNKDNLNGVFQGKRSHD